MHSHGAGHSLHIYEISGTCRILQYVGKIGSGGIRCNAVARHYIHIDHNPDNEQDSIHRCSTLPDICIQ